MVRNMRHALTLTCIALSFATAVSAQQVGPLPDIQRGGIALHLHPLITGLAAPDYAISPPGADSRLFVVEQNGLLLIVQDGALLPTPALDMRSRVSPPFVPTNANDERGFLGLAFHPQFNTPGALGFGTLYTFSSEALVPGTPPTYVAPNNAPQGYKLVVNEWKMSATNPNAVDPTSRRELISFGKNANNHNGGTIAFGPDGYLYLGLGDGGNANDVGASHIEPGGNAQNLSTPLGKMLRFDPLNPALTAGSADPISANGQYRIPTTNPFQGAGQVPEIYAYGFRNPYRYSFDRLTGELIMSDVGQNNIEEINRVTLGGNFGWAVKEGDFLFNRTIATGTPGTIGARSPGVPAGMIDPISGSLGTLEYDHSDGISITGGFVYRGSAIPELHGKYVFGDLALRNAPPRVDGRIFYADLAEGTIREFQLPLLANDKIPNGLTVHGFGQDSHGELYAAVTNTPASGAGGILYQINPAVKMAFEFKPQSIRLNSSNLPRTFSAFLEPPHGYAAGDIQVASVRLNGTVPIDTSRGVRIVEGEDDDDHGEHSHDNDCGRDHDLTLEDQAGAQRFAPRQDENHEDEDEGEHECRTRLKVYFTLDSLALANILPVGQQVPLKVTGLIGATGGFVGYDSVRVRAGRVLNPTAQEIIAPGSSYALSFDIPSDSPANLALVYSPDAGQTWKVQNTQVANTGSVDWAVPNEITGGAMLALVDAASAPNTGVDLLNAIAVSERFAIGSALEVGDRSSMLRLLPPQPNPSSGRVKLAFSLAQTGEVEVTVFDLQGRQVAQPARGVRAAGSHTVDWDGRWENGKQAEAGLYFVRLRASGQETRERLVRLQ